MKIKIIAIFCAVLLGLGAVAWDMLMVPPTMQPSSRPKGDGVIAAPSASDTFATSSTSAAAASEHDATQAVTQVAPSSLAVPDFQMAGLDGAVSSFKDLDRPVVLLHFWASWCAPCVVEFPDLLALAAAHEGAVDLVLVSLDRDVAAIEAFRQKLRAKTPALPLDGANIHWVWDEGKAISLGVFNTVKVPETLFLDRDRAVRHKAVGETNWRSEGIAALLQSIQ